MNKISIKGSAGRIEGIYKKAVNPSSPLALILHPHPKHGGTMDNSVVFATYKVLADNGFSVLRINFRGVGKSEGVFDGKDGELTDAAAALDWLQAQNTNSKNSINLIAGFSFGAWIAMHIVMRRPEISNFIAISPPVNKEDFSFLSPCPIPGFIVQGDNDSIVSVNAVRELAHKLSKQQTNIKIDHKIIAGADHFFRYKIDQFKAAIDEYLKMILSESHNIADPLNNRQETVNNKNSKMFLY